MKIGNFRKPDSRRFWTGASYLALWRFVAARASIFGMPDRPWQSRGQFFTAAVVLLVSAITRDAATGHTSLFAHSVVLNRAVTSNAILRHAADSSLSPIPSDKAIVEKIALLVRG